jgi:hypothetical protein
MLRLLRDSSWQFWGVIISILSLIFSVYVFFYPNTKAIEIAILANAPLVEINPGATDKITVLYGTRPVENPLLLQVRLENVGAETIREEDYAHPISIVLPKGSKVLEASITDTNPNDIVMTLQSSDNTVTLSKSLLNSGDRVIIRMLYNGPQKQDHMLSY